MAGIATIAALILQVIAVVVPASTASAATAALPINSPNATISLDAGVPRVIALDPSTGRVFIGIGDEIEVLSETGAFIGSIGSMYAVNSMIVVGRDLYADLSGTTAIAEIDMDTLAVLHTWSLAPYTNVFGLAFAGGKLWFTAYPSGSSFGSLVSLDPATAAIASTNAISVYGHEYLVADPTGNTLLAADKDIEPATLYTIDVSGTPTETHSLWDVSENLAQMALSADGSTVWVAGGAPYYVNEYNATTDTSTGITYDTSNYPVGVANAGSLVASVSSQALTTNNVWIFRKGAPTALWLGEVPNDLTSGPIDAGIAMSADQSHLYVVQADAKLDIFNIDLGPPGAPTGLTAAAGKAAAQLSWQAPSVSGGSPITGYVVTPYLGSVAQKPTTFQGSSTSHTVTGLTPGDTYTFKVAAMNAIGTGVASSASAPLVIPTLPGPPTIGTATAGFMSASLSWTAPTNTGGGALTGYVVTPYIGSTAQPSVTYANPATAETVSNLTIGTAYTFTVAAVNAAGTGPASARSNAVTPHRTPDASFVEAAFVDFLGREPTSDELAGITAALDAGTESRAQVVSTFAGSTQWINAIVNQLYSNTLGRAGDAGGVSYWTTQIQGGHMTVAQVAAAFYASSEYFHGIGGGTVTTWLDDLYHKLFARAPDAPGINYWTLQVAKVGRTKVALSFYQSSESCHKRVADLYQKLLGRAPDNAGWNYWAQQVAAFGDIRLAANLAASTEYLARAQTRFP